jgi:malonyl-CoA/methylmalonyl-CoA synthetase
VRCRCSPFRILGQKVVAVVRVSEECKKSDKPWGLTEMRRILKERLVNYKIPQDLEIVPEIKRNAMGKVNKKDLIPAVFGDAGRIRRRSFDIRQTRRH